MVFLDKFSIKSLQRILFFDIFAPIIKTEFPSLTIMTSYSGNTITIIMKRLITIVLALLCVNVSAQQMSDTLRIYFRQGYSSFDASYKHNQERAKAFIDRVNDFKSQSSAFDILTVNYHAGASPEGTLAINEKLAAKRSSTLTAYLKRYIDFPESIIHVQTVSEDWAGLARLVAESDMKEKNEVLDLIANVDNDKVLKTELQRLAGGRPWRYMNEHLFPELRAFTVIVEVGVENPKLDLPEIADSDVQPANEFPPIDDSLTVPMLRLPETIPLQEWARKLYIKTNAIGWAMFISNVAVEIDITPHLSFQLPIYYSAVDYFSRELKFRTFAVQPELRWWFSKPDGLFVGAHFGTAYFNYATKGDWRIQTYDGDRPLWGGGLAAGYRMPLSKRHPRWNVEFSIGAGVYDVYYDKFYNEKNGPKATNGHTTFVGIDHAAVSFSYSFDLKKRRAER